MTRFVSRLGLAVLLLVSLFASVRAEPSPRMEVGVSVLRTEDTTRTPGFLFGGSIALIRWTPLSRVALEPHLGVLLVRRNAGLTLPDNLGTTSYTLDSLEIPLLLRGELSLGGRALYATGGVYGGKLLRVQQTDTDGVRRAAETVTTLDLGLVVGAGLELGTFGGGQLLLGLRYQRSERPVLPETDSKPRSFTLLLGYRLDPDVTGDGSSSSLVAEPPLDRARSLALRTGVIATRLSSSVAKSAFAPTQGPGFSLGAAFVPARVGSWLVLAPQFELAVTHHRTNSPSGPLVTRDGARSLALDTLDTAALMRIELALSGQTLFALGGLHGSVRLAAQELRDDLAIDARDSIPALDGGWLAGAGIELAATSRARLALEVRYQRSLRDATSAGALTRESLAALIGLTYHSPRRTASAATSGAGSATASAPRPRVASNDVLIGRPGDQWLRHIEFTRIERATRDGTFGYLITYHIASHGNLSLFWPRERIDLTDTYPAFRLHSRKLRQGRLRYPDRITRRSLPRVHRHILRIERAYAAEGDGLIAVMKGFLAVTGLASARPSVRTTTPRAPSATQPRLPRAKARVKTQQGSKGSGNSTGSATTGGTAAAGSSGQLHHAISRKIHRALEKHANLAGHYKVRDPRFVTRAADGAAHRGYQRWHRDLDREVMKWIGKYDKATLAQFEAYLRKLYSRPELRARFPDGL